MKGSNHSKNGSSVMGSASESQIFEATPGDSNHQRRLSGSGQSQSQSSVYHSTRSFEVPANSGNEVSRYPYHDRTSTAGGRRKGKHPRSPRRTRSANTPGGSDTPYRGSLELNKTNSASKLDAIDSPGSSSTEEKDANPRPLVAAGRLDRSLQHNTLDRSNRTSLLDLSHTEGSLSYLNESAASLTLQESQTFPLDSETPQAACWNFAVEHRIFLKAVLELIAQRDNLASEVGMNDPNVLMSGTLKKASHLMKGAWKVKYVELRRGMFSYYEDAVSGRHQVMRSSASAELLRKNMPLEANACQCRAVRLHQKALNITPRGAIFEIAIAGRPKRLWMANSREERQAWIQAIHGAMVGGSVTRGGNPAQNSTTNKSGGIDSRSPHKEDVKKYQKVQGLLRHSKSKDDYVLALRQIYQYDLCVPVKFIAKQAEQEQKGTSAGVNSSVKGAFHEEDVRKSVDQLFKDLHRDTIKIDDEVFMGNSGHAPERIMGALARRIMLAGRRSDANYGGYAEKIGRAASKYDMSESQALAYARDVLLSGNRTRSGGDSYFCVNTLTKNDDLVVLVPSSTEAEPVSITVTREDEDDGRLQDTSKSGWLRTRRRTRNKWTKAYFDLSAGTLSYYRQALPRPHGLLGQISIVDTNISIEREDGRSNNGEPLFVLRISKGGLERQIQLEGEGKMIVWAYALECSSKARGGAKPAPLMHAMRGVMNVPAAAVGAARRASLGAIPMMAGRNSLTGMEDISSKNVEKEEEKKEKKEKPETAEAALKEHVAKLGLDFSTLEERLSAYSRLQSAWVKASIKASTMYKVCTLDPDGDENEDTWAVVEATFLQEFRVTGGHNPRIMRGEEIVRVDVVKCNSIAASVRRSSSGNEGIESGDSPNRRGQMARLLRTFSDDVEYRGKGVANKGNR